jgi:hypothetical protein
MGAWISVNCPVQGCSYGATFRLAMGEETNGRAERVAILRDEHPDHPPIEEPRESPDSN